TDTRFNRLSDLDVTVYLEDSHLEQTSVFLTSPTGVTIQLFYQQIKNAGGTIIAGLPAGTNLGVLTLPGNVFATFGTAFNDDAARSVVDSTVAAPYPEQVQPEDD